MSLSLDDKKKLCSGCRANRYNMGKGFQESSDDAPVTVDECWYLKGAKVVNKLVYYSSSQVNPTLRTKTLSCWHNELGFGQVIKQRS